MRDRTVSEKVKVFISSFIDDKYKIVRKSLKLLLEETNMCEVFVFEKSNASTDDVVNYFLDKIEDVDVCIFLIDNKKGVTDGVLKERNRAKELKKKAIYIFCDEEERTKTNLQSELENGLLEKYDVVHEFAEFPQKAYQSIIDDIALMYRKYCRHILERTDSDDNIEKKVIVNMKSGVVEKSKIVPFGKTKELVCEIMGFLCLEQEETSLLDEACLPVIKWILGEGGIDNISFEVIEQEILKCHSSNKKGYIKKRVQAFKAYVLGDLTNALAFLKEAYDLGKQCADIAGWELNDVAIDMRSVDQQKNLGRDIRKFSENVGQKLIDASEENIYYPLLDRYVENYLERVIKDIREYELDSPYTYRTTNWYCLIGTAVNAFVIAFMNCSITQMLCLRKRLITFCEEMLLVFHDHKLYCFLLRLLILERDEKEIKRFSRKYGESTQYMCDKDIEKILDSISFIMFEYQKNISMIMLLKHYGNFFSDIQFRRSWNEILRLYKAWITEKDKIMSYGSEILEIIRCNDNRLDVAQSVDIIKSYIDNDLFFWIDDIFKTLYVLPLDKMTVDSQADFINWLCNLLDREECNNLINLEKSLVHIRKLALKNFEKLDAKVFEKLPDFYEDLYTLECFKNNTQECKRHIKRYLDDMEIRNVLQGKNGMYTQYLDSPYTTIKNIIDYNKVSLDDNLLPQILSVMEETLLSHSMNMQIKIDGLRLVIFLAGQYSGKENVKKFWQKCKERSDDILAYSKITMYDELYKSTLELAFLMANIAMNGQYEEAFLSSFVKALDSEDKDTINVLDTVYVFISSNPNNTISYSDIYPIVLMLTNNKEKDIRFRAVRILVELSKEKNTEEILRIFSKMMDDEVAETKVAILARLKNIPGDENMRNAIFQKGRVDNHFWVRQVADRFSEDLM